MKHRYRLESFYFGKWVNFLEAPLTFLRGYLRAKEHSAPRLAFRIVRDGVDVVDEIPARDDVNIGMVAGFPTAEQYETAALAAVEKAKRLREIEAERDNRLKGN